ncbi:unnamed protein product [Taenia asiatica]|uniref:Hexosyltransferase n=1 Tax=Taenia asiatica TaxID=60517 RepID=A0A0R3WG64_TAEAS|nr:unnamed protein product [Taenia asiatica]
MQVVRTSSSVCSGNTTHDLVIVVKSGILGWEARKQFRAYMQRQRDLNPNTKLGVVFSLGLPRQHGGRIFNRDGHLRILEGQAGDRMDEYIGRSSEVMQRIEEEIRTYDDIILTDFEDTYYNLTWKTVTNLRWLSAFCDKVHNDVFMIVDDDHGMNVSRLMQFLASIPRAKKRTTLFGYIARADGATRSPLSKYFLSQREVPWSRMCAYPRGFCQIIGADIIDDMAIGSAYTRHNYLHEDVYLGLLTFKLGIPLQHVDTMFSESMHPKPGVMVAGLNFWNSI